MIPSTAHVTFRPGGVAGVDAALRLTASSHIQCCTYPDHPAILAVTDAHVSVSLSVPGSQVTPEDVAIARRLADALHQYIADLEHRLTSPAPADAGVAA
jgi:S-adenosylmethionine/arginine decarboxylase-like enzyme